MRPIVGAALTLVTACCLAGSLAAEPPQAHPPGHQATVIARPTGVAVPLRRDLAADEIWVDNQGSCKLWVRFENRGNVKIDKTLYTKVTIGGVKVYEQAMHVVLDPDQGFGHEVGTTANPIKVIGSKLVVYVVDSTGVLTESDEGNNTLSKTITCQ